MDRRRVLAFGLASAVLPAAASSASTGEQNSGPVKLIAIYDRPDDTTAFFEHYEAVHAPLVKRTPGLQSFVLNRVTDDLLGGEPAYVLIAEMTYPDRATFEAAMKSPENAAAGQDLMSFAKGKVRVLVADCTLA